MVGLRCHGALLDCMWLMHRIGETLRMGRARGQGGAGSVVHLPLLFLLLVTVLLLFTVAVDEPMKVLLKVMGL